MDVPCFYRIADPVQNLRLKITLTRVTATFNNNQDDGNKKENTETKTNEDGLKLNEDSDDSDSEQALLDKKKNKNKKNKKEELNISMIPAAQANKTRTWTSTFSYQEKKFGPREILMYRPGGVDGEEGNADDIVGKSPVQIEYHEELKKKSAFGVNLLKDTYPVCLFTYTDKDGFVPKPELAKFTTTSNDFSLNKVARSIVSLPMRGLLSATSLLSGYGVGQRMLREGPSKVFYIMAAVDVDPSSFNSSGVKLPEFYEVVLCSVRVPRDGNLVEMRPGLSTSRLGQDPALTLAAATAAVDASKNHLIKHSFRTPSGSVYEYTVENEAENSRADRDGVGGSTASAEEDLNALENERAKRVIASQRLRVGDTLIGCPTRAHQTRCHCFAEIVSVSDFDTYGDSLYVQYEVVLPPTRAWQWDADMNVMKDKRNHGVVLNAPSIETRHDNANTKPSADRKRNQNSSSANVDQQHNKNNRQQRIVCGVTQSATPRDRPRGKRNPQGGPIAHFAFPIQLEMVHESSISGSGSSGSGGSNAEHLFADHKMPQMLLQVKSRDWLGRHRVEGYGYIDMPSEPGVHDIEVRTWKPKGTIRQQAQDMLIGGSRQLESSMYTAVPQTHDGPFLNRYGFTSESSGLIRVRMNWVTQRYVDKTVVSQVTEQAKAKQEKHARAKRTVEEILSSLTLSSKGGGGAKGRGRTASTGSGSAELLASVARLRKEKEAARLREDHNRQRESDERDRVEREARVARLRARLQPGRGVGRTPGRSSVSGTPGNLQSSSIDDNNQGPSTPNTQSLRAVPMSMEERERRSESQSSASSIENMSSTLGRNRASTSIGATSVSMSGRENEREGEESGRLDQQQQRSDVMEEDL